MPLLDHFHPPLLGHRHWEGFLGRWAAAIADSLNEDLLPPEYFAEFQVTVGTRVEVDAATFAEGGASEAARPNGAAVAVETHVWAPFPTPTPLYATAYRPAHREDRNEIDLWREPLALGEPLPTLPLAVRGLGWVPIDLEGTYTEATKRSRIG